MSELSDWTHATTDISERGLSRERAASAVERDAIAASLELIALKSLVAAYRIAGLPGGGWRLSGSVDAEVVQSCIVTLEPVESRVSEKFETEFWDEDAASQPEGEQDVLSGPEIETLENGLIPVGRIVIETLSAALDPYPRKEGAEFSWDDPAAKDEKKSSPFAVLAKIKKSE